MSLDEPGPRPGPIDNADLLGPHPVGGRGCMHVVCSQPLPTSCASHPWVGAGPPPSPASCFGIRPLPALPACAQAASDLTEEQRAGVAHLRAGAQERADYWLLHEPTWNLLREW